MKAKFSVKPIALLAIIIFIITTLAKNPQTLKEFITVISGSIGTTALVYFLFIKFLWKWPLIDKLEYFHQVPVLEGKWDGTFNSNGNTTTPANSGEVKVQISQPDLFTIKITRTSDISMSRSIAEHIDTEPDGQTFLTYTYFNDPTATERANDKYKRGYGTARLLLTRGKTMKLDGDYWTDIGTTGTFNIKRLKTK